MALINIDYGSVANSSPLNNNFNYLDGKVEEASTAITSVNANLQTRLANVQSTLESSIASVESEMQSELDDYKTEVGVTLDNFRTEINNSYGKPAMIPIVDWNYMATLAGASVESLRSGINNTVTGIKAYYEASAGLHQGDIYFKEDFTNYPRILVVYTPSNPSGYYLQSNIINTWELDFNLGYASGGYANTTALTSLTNDAIGQAWYYGIHGYNQPTTIGSAVFKTNKKFFFCYTTRNCGLVEIYGLTNSVIDSYIVDGATAFSSGWLSETEDGEALTPSVGTLYIVRTAGSYLDKAYKWTGTEYEEVTDAIL